jgi:leucyl aminopeptidase
MTNSHIADINNIGSDSRGAEWAHLDIAGVAWKNNGDSLVVKSATGYGIRLLNQFIIDNYKR